MTSERDRAILAKTHVASKYSRALFHWRAARNAKGSTDKLTYVGEVDAQKVMAALPTCQWRLLFALSRWGGLRVGSEVRLLTWSDVDWEKAKFVVNSPKTKRHAGHEKRTLPLFPELATVLAERFAESAEGETSVLPMLATRSDSSLRDTLIRAIEDAGLAVWPRLWHNLRSSRQTDLEDSFKPKVVCTWLGNSEAISPKHYIQVTESDFAKASQRATRPPEESDNLLRGQQENVSERKTNKLLRHTVDAAQKAAQSATENRDHNCQPSDNLAKTSEYSYLLNHRQPLTCQKAVGEGFEPPVQFPVRRFSRPVPSTTRPPDPCGLTLRGTWKSVNLAGIASCLAAALCVTLTGGGGAVTKNGLPIGVASRGSRRLLFWSRD
jgi:integrase